MPRASVGMATQSHLRSAAGCALEQAGLLLGSRLASLAAHEGAHYLTALALGCTALSINISSIACYLRGESAASLHAPGISKGHSTIVRHAGWILSTMLLLLLLVLPNIPPSVLLGSLWTSLDAITSDLMQIPVAGAGEHTFFCGNFGILVLRSIQRSRAYELLFDMLRVTMVRGAQSAGIATYEHRKGHTYGFRARVVNGKRTDLSKLMLKKLHSRHGVLGRFRSPKLESGRLFQGHTRFATSSVANLPGCHPHQWSPHRYHKHWRYEGGSFVGNLANVEGFITHNGDLDLFEIHRESYPVDEMQSLLSHLLGAPPPADVDSAVIAGLLDLLRAKGVWAAAVRYGYLYGALSHSSKKPSLILDQLATHAELLRVAVHFEEVWESLLDTPPSCEAEGVEDEAALTLRLGKLLEERMVDWLTNVNKLRLPEGLPIMALSNFVKTSMRGFFYQDLVQAAFTLLQGSQGSFGLVLSHSLDAGRELVVAARGQTMSVAFYPSAGLVSFGSEASATKVPMQEGETDSFRLDLNDVSGEVLLLRWGKNDCGGHEQLPGVSHGHATQIMSYEGGVLTGTSFLEDGSPHPWWNRRLQLGGNPLVSRPVSRSSGDAVGVDLMDCARVMRLIDEDWALGPDSLNRVSAWNLVSKLRERMLRRAAGSSGEESVDLLLTGCEASLWLAEQFAADMHLVFPRLKVVAISANKLIGQLGQHYAMPQLGFCFNQNTYALKDSIVLALSHSGGTFGTLACCNLLRGYTPHIFAITSEWDTQVARSVRGSIELSSDRVFSTFAGFRAAEPCSISMVSMHHLLSHVLVFVMSYISHFNGNQLLGGSNYQMEEVRELEALKRGQARAVEQIVGILELGDTPASADIRSLGRVWGMHVLEAPISWVLGLTYILATLLARATPATAVLDAAWKTEEGEETPHGKEVVEYMVNVLDALIYAFLPWWTTVLIRLVQRRPWLHRVAGRSILIGDIPWVAQAVEAFASKCFALGYSIATPSFASANPSDHLVHRHTHRVVRGSLLALGRPDGRLNSLTTAEAACCLSLNQACSIQNLGVTCESITIGHNPFQLPLSTRAITLPTKRLRFISELLVELEIDDASCSEHGSLSRSARDISRSGRDISRSGRDASRSAHGDASRHGEPHIGERTPSFDGSSHGARWHHRISSTVESLERSLHGKLPLMSPSNSHHGSKRYLHNSAIVEAIANGGSLRRGNAFVEAFVNHCPKNSTTLPPRKGARPKQFFPRVRCMRSRTSARHKMSKGSSPNKQPRGAAAGEENVRTSYSICGIRARLDRMKSDDKLARRTVRKYGRAGAERRVKMLELQAIETISEPFLGAWMIKRHRMEDVPISTFMVRQQLLQQLNETRFDSMQRAVAFFVLFHKMATDVQSFWSTASLGFLGYDISRTQSILRVATTASPVGGTEVRDKMAEIDMELQKERASSTIQRAMRSALGASHRAT